MAQADKKRSSDCVDADTACFLQMRSPKSFFFGGAGAEEFVFFLHFLCKFEAHDCFNVSCKVSWRIRFTDSDTAFIESLSFSVVKSLILQSLILFWTFKLKYPGLLVWSPYNLLL